MYHAYNMDNITIEAMAMRTLSSREVQKNFGSVADLVKAGESVRVTQYGRPAFVMIPEGQDTEELLRRMAGKRLVRLLKDATPSAEAQALTQQDVNNLINECFA
jgi:antitoxin (DNA-binding transcriptional repressor) of toxin-antitoxin stability system